MARLGQLNPSNYTNSQKINEEFENIIRYLVAVEKGNKTLGEMLDVVFDDDGIFSPNVEIRLDPSEGLQYRTGEYANSEDGWKDIADIADVRGPAGASVGTIEGPFFYNRQDSVPANATTVLSYAHDDTTDDILVYKNGLLLKSPADYTHDAGADTVTLVVACNGTDKITIISVRKQTVSDYRRSDLVAVGAQAVFPFVHTSNETLLVWRNGILQRPGGGNDYTSSDATDTITFTVACADGDKVTIMTVDNTALTNVGGLMLEDEYATNGLINWAKINVADGAIAQAKVAGLVTLAAQAGLVSVGAGTPSVTAFKFWIKTSTTPNTLFFSDGVQWLPVSPNSAVPTFTVSNANQYLRVNGSGTALEFGTIDFSALVPKTYMAAANGVASLDATGKIPIAQLPEIFAASTMPFFASGAVPDGTYLIQRIYKQKIRIDGITRKLASGTCNIQLAVDGVTVGSVFAVSSTAADSQITPVIEIDALSVSRRLTVVVTSGAAANGLEIGLSASVLTV